MIYNYHTHTFRCSHASGIERNYIERAIANGVKKMGFSDHAPFMHDDGFEAHYRVKIKDVKNYFDTLKALREEYKNKIEIFIGFEIECYPSYYEKMVKFAVNAGAEYLILGQHHTDTDRQNDPNGEDYFYPFKANDD
ncbi:MAG: PHP domain-containing protein, partial [Clostridia bacterium]|nr:PHP domain-containing protein [Clostridia bacterium]